MLVCVSMYMSRSRGIELEAPQVTCQAQSGPGHFQWQLQPLGCYLGTQLRKVLQKQNPIQSSSPNLNKAENFLSAKYFCTDKAL